MHCSFLDMHNSYTSCSRFFRYELAVVVDSVHDSVVSSLENKSEMSYVSDRKVFSLAVFSSVSLGPEFSSWSAFCVEAKTVGPSTGGGVRIQNPKMNQ